MRQQSFFPIYNVIDVIHRPPGKQSSYTRKLRVGRQRNGKMTCIPTSFIMYLLVERNDVIRVLYCCRVRFIF